MRENNEDENSKKLADADDREYQQLEENEEIDLFELEKELKRHDKDTQTDRAQVKVLYLPKSAASENAAAKYWQTKHFKD